jgi:hypothetical protein
MGVSITPMLIIGKEFTNEKKGTDYFQSKIKMTKEDLDEMGPHLMYWLEARQKNGYPVCGEFDSYQTGGIFYLGYVIKEKTPEKLMEAVAQAEEKCKALFNDKPDVVHTVYYH